MTGAGAAAGRGATTLVVTNDFPPRLGGIESFVATLCRLLDDDVVVLTSAAAGDAAYDSGLAYPVVRLRGPLLPTRRVAREAERLLREHGCTRVVFGAAAPLGLLARRLRPHGVRRILAITHGHETWWARLPVFRALVGRIGATVDHVSCISDFTAAAIVPALDAGARDRVLRLSPPVDVERFRPPATRPARPTAVAAGRMIEQKGFATLLRAWAQVVRRWPADAEPPRLRLVGDGPRRGRLVHLAARLGIAGSVDFVGPVPHAGMPAVLGAAHVFALPVRTRRAGLNPEGLGLVFLEAAACGLAVVAGRSGGAPETVRSGVTGEVVEPDDVDGLAAHLSALLGDLPKAAAMGRAGRRLVGERFATDRARATLLGALDLPTGPDDAA